MAEETHVAVSHEGEAEHTEHEEAAAAAVATAGAAVALAHETAAHAELQAAEEVAEIKEEADEWRTNLETGLLSLSDSVRALREDELSLHASERQELRLSLDGLLQRLDAIERHPSLRSTPPASEAEEVSETAQTSEEADNLAGAAANVQLGPAEVGSSASLQNPIPSEPEPRKRKRHWI